MRVKRGVAAHKKHNKIRKATKGMSHPRRSSTRLGRQGVIKALQYAYRDRRNKKRTLRSLWNARINSAARLQNVSYSQLIHGMKQNNIEIDRKILSELAVREPKAFEEVVKASIK